MSSVWLLYHRFSIPLIPQIPLVVEAVFNPAVIPETQVKCTKLGFKIYSKKRHYRLIASPHLTANPMPWKKMAEGHMPQARKQ